MKANREQELDLTCILRQNDYLEARLPRQLKSLVGYRLQDISVMDEIENDRRMARETDALCVYPSEESEAEVKQFVWEDLTIDERVKRASYRSQIVADLEDMEPQLSNKVFDFYGVYTRISEAQKYKWAEGR